VTEYLPIVGANDPLEFLLDLWDEANVLEERYGLISEGKMKFLLQSVGRALQGRYAKKWKKFASVISIADSTATRHEATNRGMAGNEKVRNRSLLCEERFRMFCAALGGCKTDEKVRFHASWWSPTLL